MGVEVLGVEVMGEEVQLEAAVVAAEVCIFCTYSLVYRYSVSFAPTVVHLGSKYSHATCSSS